MRLAAPRLATSAVVALLGLALTVSVAVAPVAAAGERRAPGLPSRIDLPDGFQPEGIASGPGGRLYVGSLAGGAIWKGSALTGRGRILVKPVEGQVATGIHLDRLGRLWVAGGGNGTIRVYSSRTGRLLRTYSFPTPAFINDLTITGNRVYATDSLNQYLAVVPLRRWARLPSPDRARTLPLTGDISYSAGFNANGITTRNGRLILVQSNEGLLFRVNPRTGATRAIDTHGYGVTNGDGIEVRDGKLYVIRNRDNLVAVLRLDRRLRDARLVREITSPGFDVPTTATFALGRLWAVNARFGTTDPQPADYWITRVPSR